MSESIISHPGVIKSITDKTIELSIIVKSGCATCESKTSCSLIENEEKIIYVDVPDSTPFKAGQSVIVEMKQSQGTWAVLLGYAFPFIILIFTLFAFISLGFEQGVAGLATIGSLIVYYLFLYFFKNFIKKKFIYRIK